MAETKTTERIYIIPLRREWEKAPRYKRAKKANRAIKEFLVKHMKIYDRDLKKIKIERWLNMHIWERGIKKPPARVKVKAVKENDVVRVELAELPKKAIREQEKKKAQEDKKKSKTEKAKEEKEKAKEKQEETQDEKQKEQK